MSGDQQPGTHQEPVGGHAGGTISSSPNTPSPKGGFGRMLVIVLVGLSGVAAAWLGWTLGSRGAPGDTSGQELPFASIVLPVLDGERDGPGLHPGEISVLDFWATWCAPCRVQAKILDEVAADFAPRGVNFFAIDVGEPADLVRESVQDDPYPYPVLLDETGDLSAEFGIYMLPTVVVVAADGKVALSKPGITGRTQLTNLLNELLSEPDVRATGETDDA